MIVKVEDCIDVLVAVFDIGVKVSVVVMVERVVVVLFVIVLVGVVLEVIEVMVVEVSVIVEGVIVVLVVVLLKVVLVLVVLVVAILINVDEKADIGVVVDAVIQGVSLILTLLKYIV